MTRRSYTWHRGLPAAVLAMTLMFSLAAPTLAARIDTSNMPGHEVLSQLPDALQRPAPPSTLEQATGRVNDNYPTEWTLTQSKESVFQDIVKLTDSLTAGKSTDTQKVRAIYNWVSQNVEYDDTAYGFWRKQDAGQQLTDAERARIDQAADPFFTYVRKLAICDGYSKLCWLMCSIAEVPAAYISGISNTAESARNGGGPHAWNAALEDGKWLFFDATWSRWDMPPNYHETSEEVRYYTGVFQVNFFVGDNGTQTTLYELCQGFEYPDEEFVVFDGFLLKYQGPGGNITIPSSVTSIEECAFLDCESLISVTIPSGVTEIKDHAFRDCVSLTGVTIPDSVTRIGNYAFSGCESLASVTIPSSVTDIGIQAFGGTPWQENQGEFVILNGVLIDYQGFGGEVTISDGVTEIGWEAFRDCEFLTSVTIPDSMTEIEWMAFFGCTALTDVYYGGTEEQWKAIQIGHFNDPLISATVHYNSVMPKPVPAVLTAIPTNDALTVDGVAQVPTAYKIGGANYFQLRDVAMLLNGTPAQFSVDYDEALKAVKITTGRPYTPLGWELAGAATGSAEAIEGNNDVYINGVKSDFDVYKIGGNNFFQIRALGEALGFNVGWSKAAGMYIESNKPYSDAD